MYDKQHEVGKVCNLVKIFETICFGVQNYTQITANYFKLKQKYLQLKQRKKQQKYEDISK
mgnify:FL=1